MQLGTAGANVDRDRRAGGLGLHIGAEVKPGHSRAARNKPATDASDAAKDLNGDGYNNIEKFINGLDPSKKVDWKDPKNNVDPRIGAGSKTASIAR